MWLPWDHAMDREWWFGLRNARVVPFPIDQSVAGLGSTTADGKRSAQQKLPAVRRFATTYPYQAMNNTARLLVRGSRWASARLAR